MSRHLVQRVCRVGSDAGWASAQVYCVLCRREVRVELLIFEPVTMWTGNRLGNLSVLARLPFGAVPPLGRSPFEVSGQGKGGGCGTRTASDRDREVFEWGVKSEIQ